MHQAGTTWRFTSKHAPDLNWNPELNVRIQSEELKTYMHPDLWRWKNYPHGHLMDGEGILKWNEFWEAATEKGSQMQASKRRENAERCHREWHNS